MAWPKGEKPAREYMAWEGKEYKPTHCTDLIFIMSKGGGFQTFCAKNNMGRTVFYEWLKKYPELKLSYEIGKMCFDRYMLELLQEHQVEVDDKGVQRLNLGIWKELQKNVRKKPDEQEAVAEIEGDAKTMMSRVLRCVAYGVLTIEDAHKMAQTLEIAQKVCEVSELSARLDEIERSLDSGSNMNEFKEEVTE